MEKYRGGLILSIFSTAALSSCSDPRIYKEPEKIIEKTTAVLIKDYCPTDGYKFSEIFSYNSSSIFNPSEARSIMDYDRDGLSDEFENQESIKKRFNVGSANWDTNGDAYSDSLMYAIGYDQENQIRLSSCAFAFQDTDNDDLPDCAEAVLRTDPTLPDSDRDGVPDGIEIRFGTNPLDPMDVITDFDQDGLTALQEIKANLPIRFTNDGRISEKGYTYKVKTFNNGTQDCYDIQISNIPVMRVSNGNLIKIFAVENNTVPTQGDITRISTLQVLVPRGIQDHLRVVINNGISNQVIDGIAEPLVLEDDAEDLL